MAGLSDPGRRPARKPAAPRKPRAARAKKTPGPADGNGLFDNADGAPTAPKVAREAAGEVEYPIFGETPAEAAARAGALTATRTGARKSPAAAPISVGVLTRRIRDLLEDGFARVLVEGEITNCKAAPSGHLYFALRDDEALIEAVCWRSTAARLAFAPQDGDRVVARGAVGVYPPRGRYQLVVSALSRSGDGDRRARFAALVEKLRAEGLFDPARKRPLPAHPRTVGIVTSPTGAALRDILKILRRRAPHIRAVVSPCLVQGETAPASIRAALAALIDWGGADVIVIGRGGGSAEELSAFNDEALARALAACPAPTISAVGHEVDISITDLVADRRAATPSEAAELVAVDLSQRRAALRHLAARMDRALTEELRAARARWRALAESPLWRRMPAALLETPRRRLDETAERLARGFDARLSGARNALALTAAKLEALSPLAVLSRGYSVTTDAQGRVIARVADLPPDGRVRTRLGDGAFWSRVEKNNRNS